jgi:hypothetical protein
MGNETIDGLVNIVYAMDAFYPVIKAFVPRGRRTNDYCHSHSWNFDRLEDCKDTTDFFHWTGNLTRYQWCNFTAYRKFKTCEIRLHRATLDGKTVCNWVKAFTRFMDWASKASREEIEGYRGQAADKLFGKLATIWDDRELTDYYQQQAARFGTSIVFQPLKQAV